MVKLCMSQHQSQKNNEPRKKRFEAIQTKHWPVEREEDWGRRWRIWAVIREESDPQVVGAVRSAAKHRSSRPRDTIEKRPTTSRVSTLPCDTSLPRGIGSKEHLWRSNSKVIRGGNEVPAGGWCLAETETKGKTIMTGG